MSIADDYQALRAMVWGALRDVGAPDIDTDLIFEKIESALRKRLNLSFAQCDCILADVRADIEGLIDEELDGAIDFHEAVDAIEDLIDEELGDGPDTP